MPGSDGVPYGELMARYSGVGNAADVVHAVLRHSIIHGQLRPGSRFRAEEMAKQLGMSRTPVREAHLRLEAEGLLTVKPGVGLVVAEFSEEEVIETYAIREALEGMAARLAAEHASARDLDVIRSVAAELKDACKASDFARLREGSGAFHLAVARAARNARLHATIAEIQDTFRRFVPSTMTNAERGAEAVAELEAILHAIETRDPEAAERAARAHRRRTLVLHVAASRPT